MNFYEIALVVGALVYGCWMGFYVGVRWPNRKAPEPINYSDYVP